MIDYFEYDQNASLAKNDWLLVKNVCWHSKYIEQLQKSLELKSKAILKKDELLISFFRTLKMIQKQYLLNHIEIFAQE